MSELGKYDDSYKSKTDDNWFCQWSAVLKSVEFSPSIRRKNLTENEIEKINTNYINEEITK